MVLWELLSIEAELPNAQLVSLCIAQPLPAIAARTIARSTITTIAALFFCFFISLPLNKDFLFLPWVFQEMSVFQDTKFHYNDFYYFVNS